MVVFLRLLDAGLAGFTSGSAETAVEGEKGQLSKALVRAAVKFGIGRYLYNIETSWVSLNKFGGIDDSEQWKLDKAKPKPKPG